MNPEPNAVSLSWNGTDFLFTLAYVQPGTSNAKTVSKTRQSAQQLQEWFDLLNAAISKGEGCVNAPGLALQVPIGLAHTVTQRIEHELSPKTFAFNGNSRFTTKWLKNDDFLFVFGEKDDSDWKRGVISGHIKKSELERLSKTMLEWSARHTNSPATQASSHLYIRLGQFASLVLPPEAHLRLSPGFCSIVGKQLSDYMERVAQGQEQPVPGFLDL